MVYLIATTGALFVFSITQVVCALWGRERRQVLTRLEAITAGPKVPQVDDELQVPFAQRVLWPAVQRAGKMASRLTPQGFHQGVKGKLILAGSPSRLGVVEFSGLMGLGAVAGIFIGLGIGRLLDGFLPLWGVLGAGVGLAIPNLYLQQLVTTRRTDVQKGLPDVLDLLTISVEAGLGFDGAMVRVVEKLGGVLGEEFSRVLQEVKMGKARREALRDMSDRVGVEDLSTFISAVVQAEQLGVGIAPVLRIQSQAMRLKRRQRAEEQAMQAPVKMLIPLVFFIFPGLFVVLLGPAVIQIVETLLKM